AMRTAVQVARIRGAGYDMDAATVMNWVTRNGAAALGLGDDLGMLAPGRLADILILDRAPNLCPLISGVGQVVYSAVGMNVDTRDRRRADRPRACRARPGGGRGDRSRRPTDRERPVDQARAVMEAVARSGAFRRGARCAPARPG